MKRATGPRCLLGAALLALAACAGTPASRSADTISEPGVPKQLQARQIIVALAESERAQWDAIAHDFMQDGGGAALMKYDPNQNRWTLVTWGGGAWDAPELVAEGVPQDNVTALLSGLYK